MTTREPPVRAAIAELVRLAFYCLNLSREKSFFRERILPDSESETNRRVSAADGVPCASPSGAPQELCAANLRKGLTVT